MPLTLEAEDPVTLRWWVDASYAVHSDMKGHTGGSLSLGRGGVYNTSSRQKLVSRSSTEAELVGVHDVMPQIIWTRYFLQSQGLKVPESVLYQDNKSAILLEQNGRQSSGKRTRHINIRYFFIKDRVGAGELRIEYCPTSEMVGDFFTKPLQGTPFRKLRDFIMNIDPSSPHYSGHRSVLETKRAVTRDSNGNEQDGDDSPDGSEEHHHTGEDGEDTGTQTEEKIGK